MVLTKTGKGRPSSWWCTGCGTSAWSDHPPIAGTYQGLEVVWLTSRDRASRPWPRTLKNDCDLVVTEAVLQA
jgi:hypothetical protein